MGLFDSAKNIYSAAKDVASDVLGKDGIDKLNDLKDSAFSAGTHIKNAAADALNNSDSELINKVKSFNKGVKQEIESDTVTIEDYEQQDIGSEYANLVPAICTQCGAPLNVDPSWESAVCTHCGTTFVVSKAINQYQVKHANIRANTVQVHKKGTVEATLSFIEKRREQKKEAERQEAERRRIEEEKRKAQEEAARAKRKAWIKRYGLKALLAFLLAVIIFTAVGAVLLTTSRQGKISAGISSSELLKNNYTFAEQALRKAGFSDITLLADPDLVLGLFNSDGQVKSVSIGTKTSFSSLSYFRADEPVVITYHTYPSKVNSEKESSPPSETALSTTSTPAPTPKPTRQPTPTPSGKEEEILTSANSSDLASILTADYLDGEALSSFVQKYKGKTIEFNCLVGLLTPNPKYKTICTYILVPGTDQSDIGATMFLLKDASMMTFHWDSDTRPAYLEQWSKIRVRAKVEDWTDSMYIEVKPVKTWGTQFADPIPAATPKPTAEPSSPLNPVNDGLPIMQGTSLEKVIQVAEYFGLSRAFSDQDFGHGTKYCSLQSQSGGLTLDVIYLPATDEILCARVVTFNDLSSTDEQRGFIQSISNALCPENSLPSVSAWVSNNIGGSQKTSIDSFVYELALGPSGNLLYYAGIENWENWDANFASASNQTTSSATDSNSNSAEITEPAIDPYSLYADLGEGSYGDNVRELQSRLIQLGYLNDSADGSFGGNTRAAVEAFQNENGFPVDGIASAAFQMALFSENAIPARWVLDANYESDNSFIPISEPIPETASTPTREIPQQSGPMVWIPTNGGTKYHSKPSCSSMVDPAHVTLDEAVSLGFTPCGRCY